MSMLEGTKYLLDSWVAGRSLTGHKQLEDGTWQYFGPLAIVGMIVGREVLEGAAHTEVELKNSSIEFAVWWKELQQ